MEVRLKNRVILVNQQRYDGVYTGTYAAVHSSVVRRCRR